MLLNHIIGCGNYSPFSLNNIRNKSFFKVQYECIDFAKEENYQYEVRAYGNNKTKTRNSALIMLNQITFLNTSELASTCECFPNAANFVFGYIS